MARIKIKFLIVFKELNRKKIGLKYQPNLFISLMDLKINLERISTIYCASLIIAFSNSVKLMVNDCNLFNS